MRLRIFASVAVLCATGCTVGPSFKPPPPPPVQHWRNVADPNVSFDTDPDPRWWESFDDPVLTELIDTGIRQNLDVQQAVLRVMEVRQSVVTAAAAGLPTVGGTASYARDQLGAKGILESRGVYQQLNQLANDASTTTGGAISVASNGSFADRVLNPITQPIDLYQGALSASWELDLFGRVRRSVEEARAQTKSQIEALNDALISLESEVAQAYVQLRGAQALRLSGEKTIGLAKDSLDLTIDRQRKGLSTALDVNQAQTQLQTLERQLPEYDKQEQQAVHRLNLLIGRPPGTLEASLSQPAPLHVPSAMVGIGLPSSLARRRPDIRGAEAALHAAVATVGVAVASFYPDVSLTGNLGVRATDASYITRWASHFYSAGPSVSLPIFEGGRLTAGLRLARAQAAEAALRYRAIVLNALREVEDGLIVFRADQVERARQAGVQSAADDTLALASSRYAQGLSDYLQVLDAERTAETSRQQLIQNDLSLANDVITLYRALGGGWEASGAEIKPPAISSAPPPTPAALDAVIDSSK